MSKVSGVNNNQLRPGRERKARPTRDHETSEGESAVQERGSGPGLRKDSIELSAEAQELLRQSRKSRG